MFALTKERIILLLLIFAVLSSTWLTFKSSQNHPVHSRHDNSMDSFAVTVHAINMDKDGHPSAALTSPELVHFPQDNQTKLQTPDVTIYVKDQKPWRARAKSGMMKNGISEVELNDEVNLHQDSGPNNHETTITTENLNVFPESKTAKTRAPIELTEPGMQIDSIGVDVDFNKGTINLLNQARGLYEKNEENNP